MALPKHTELHYRIWHYFYLTICGAVFFFLTRPKDCQIEYISSTFLIPLILLDILFLVKILSLLTFV